MNHDKKTQNLVINTIRTLSMDAIQKANSGHPGSAMSLAPVAFTLFDEFMHYNPAKPLWPNRDRFVLSAGHVSMLQYAVLHLTGYDIKKKDIENFRQLNSICAGHPEYGRAPGIECTTGPLGQGAATSVGFAIAERWLAHYFNKPGHEIINYKTFVVTGDGCMMEGITSEAASLAGHLGLNKLVWIYDSNNITIEGKTDLAFSEDVALRFKAYNWAVQNVEDANDLDLLKTAIKTATDEQEKPSLVIVKSHIAYGSPNKQDSAAAHGAPLGEDEVKATKKFYGWDSEENFYIPEEVKNYREQIISKGKTTEAEWQKLFDVYATKYPDLAKEFDMIQKGELPLQWEKSLPEFPGDEKGVASRAANGKVINAITAKIPWLIGGSADLAPSTKTLINDSNSFSRTVQNGRNFHFGVREHAMGAVVNGLVLSKLRAYGSTFLVFSDYMRPSIRMAAIMKIPALFIFTHDSIGVGEDGPTHQPVEHIASLRALPNIDVIRPADANECSALWKYILSITDRPVALALSRQNLPTLDRKKYASADEALKGGYILADSNGQPDIILLGTGSEIQLCIAAYEKLKNQGINARVVSMPCWTLFDRQSADYKESVLPKAVTARIAVEAGVTMGWTDYTGSKDAVIGIDNFGTSAPLKEVMKEYGFTVDEVVNAAKKRINEQN